MYSNFTWFALLFYVIVDIYNYNFTWFALFNVNALQVRTRETNQSKYFSI